MACADQRMQQAVCTSSERCRAHCLVDKLVAKAAQHGCQMTDGCDDGCASLAGFPEPRPAAARSQKLAPGFPARDRSKSKSFWNPTQIAHSTLIFPRSHGQEHRRPREGPHRGADCRVQGGVSLSRLSVPFVVLLVVLVATTGTDRYSRCISDPSPYSDSLTPKPKGTC